MSYDYRGMEIDRSTTTSRCVSVQILGVSARFASWLQWRSHSELMEEVDWG